MVMIKNADKFTKAGKGITVKPCKPTTIASWQSVVGPFAKSGPRNAGQLLAMKSWLKQHAQLPEPMANVLALYAERGSAPAAEELAFGEGKPESVSGSLIQLEKNTCAKMPNDIRGMAKARAKDIANQHTKQDKQIVLKAVDDVGDALDKGAELIEEAAENAADAAGIGILILAIGLLFIINQRTK